MVSDEPTPGSWILADAEGNEACVVGRTGDEVTEYGHDVGAAGGGLARATDQPTQKSGMRIRWGWIIGCIVLGLAMIATGLRLIAPADRTAYIASVLAGVGTTLLLVGFVVLLERQIVDTATRAVRRAVDAQREISEARIDRLVNDLEDQVSAAWERTDAEDVDAMKRRTAELIDATTKRIVEEGNTLVEETPAQRLSSE
jgi:hypothetical protein